MIDFAKIKTKSLEIFTKLIDKLSEQSSLSGISAIALMVGVAEPHAAIYAGAVVAIAGILKVILPEFKA